MHLSNRNAEADGLVVRILDHDPHLKARKLPALAKAIDMPVAVHQQMSGKNAAAGKINQHPLAARLHVIDGLAGEWSVVIETREQRISRAEDRDRLADERAA